MLQELCLKIENTFKFSCSSSKVLFYQWKEREREKTIQELCHNEIKIMSREKEVGIKMDKLWQEVKSDKER